MNILHVTPAYYPATYWGGPTFSVYGMNNALSRLPSVVLKVITTDTAGPKLADRIDANGIDRRIFPNQEVVFTRRIAGKSVSAGLLRKLPALIIWADVVHLTSTYSFPTLPTLVLCRIFNKPLVWSPRGAIQDAYEWEGAPRQRLKRLWEVTCNALIRNGQVVMHTTAVRERVATEARIAKAKAIIVPNGVDVLPVLHQREWLSGGQLRLMYLGRLSQKKGVENLLRALKLLDDPSVSLAIYGTGQGDYVSSLHALAAALGLAGRVSFLGEVTGVEKSAAFHVADVCVVPSYTENFCMVVAEALAHGVPVIASKGTPWNELEDRQCGLWVDNSPESLVQAIDGMRRMPLAEMGRRGWEWMAKEYSWDAVATGMMGVYRALLPALAGRNIA